MDRASSSPLRSPTQKNSTVKTIDNGRGDVCVSRVCNGASSCDSEKCTSESVNGGASTPPANGVDDPETLRLLVEHDEPNDLFRFRPIEFPGNVRDECRPLLKNVPAVPPNGILLGFGKAKNGSEKDVFSNGVPQKLTSDNVTILQESLNSKQPRGIVKTTSENTSTFGSKKSSSKTSLSGYPYDESKQKSVESERHVQFHNESGHLKNDRKELCPSPVCSESSSSSSEDDSSVSLAEARAPDGGWGWVVVFASFMVNLIADGVTFSFGVMYVNFLDYFGEGKAKTAWIGSLFMAMPLLSGPVASFLTDRYGCRKMTILGSILASAGFIISAFVNNMEVLFFTFGIMAGFGLSLCYVAAVVIVAYYFEKKRSLATGLSVCGSGIGTFLFAPLTQIMLDEYGWRGTTLILAGIFLNMAVCGALMRDLPWTTTMIKAKNESRKKSREQKRLKRNESSADSFSDSKSSNTVGTASQLNAPCEATGSLGQNENRLYSSLVNLPTFVSEGENVPIEVLELMSTHKNVYNVLMQNFPNMMISSRSFSDSGRLHEIPGSQVQSAQQPFIHVPSPLAAEVTSPTNPIDKASKTAYLQWLKRNQNANVGRHFTNNVTRMPPAYLRDLRVHRQSLTYRGAMLNITRYRLRASSCPNIYRNSMTTIAKEKSQWYAGLWDFWDLLVDMLDFSHFSNPKFLLFAISNFLLYTWYDVPYVYIADSANEMGFSETDSSMLISVIGIVNMVGEIFLGWAGDWEWIDAGLIYAVCMFFCGAVTALIPLLKSYLALSAASGAFGLFIAANYSLTSIILVELITLEKFTNAYGLLLLVQGIANLIGPPLAGWIYDVTGNYDTSFYCSGAFIALSGVFLVILPANKKIRKYRALRRQKKSTSTDNETKMDAEAGKLSSTDKCDKNDSIFV